MKTLIQINNLGGLLEFLGFGIPEIGLEVGGLFLVQKKLEGVMGFDFNYGGGDGLICTDPRRGNFAANGEVIEPANQLLRELIEQGFLVVFSTKQGQMTDPAMPT